MNIDWELFLLKTHASERLTAMYMDHRLESVHETLFSEYEHAFDKQKEDEWIDIDPCEIPCSEIEL